MEFLQSIFGNPGYLPGGASFSWNYGLLWSLVGADAVIAASYLSVALALAGLLRWQAGRADSWKICLLFAFVLACAVTHILDIWVVWVPDYGLQALVKSGTAVISLVTIVCLWPTNAHLLKMSRPAELQALDDQLRGSETHQIRLLHEEQRAAFELALSEQRYRSLFERNPDAVYAFDKEGRFTSVNAAFEVLTGHTAEQALSGTFQPFVAPESIALTTACFARAAAGEAVHYEAIGIHRDGSRFIVDVTNLPIIVNDEIVGVFGIAKDITARKRAERLQREEEQRFAEIVAEAATGIVVTDVAGRVQQANAAFCKMVGYTLGELRQRILSELTHPDDLARSTSLMEAAMGRDPGSFVMEKRYVCRSGEVAWVRVSITIIRRAQGRPAGIVGIFEDITQQKQASHALQRSQSLVAMAGRVSSVGGWSVEVPGHQVIWSEVVAMIHEQPLGFSPSVEQAIDFYRPQHREPVLQAFRQCLGEGLPFDLEASITTAGGRLRWVRVLGEAVRDDRGEVCRVQGAIQDISDRKDVEAQNEFLTRRLSHMLANISDGFLTVDREFRFMFANAEAERLLGRRLPKLLGHTAWHEFPEAQGAELERKLRQAADERRTLTFEVELAGRGVWLRMSAYPSDDGLVVYFRDISDERKVRTELELLQASVARLHDMVLITEASPVEEGPRIVFVNDAFLRVTGYEREEVLGRQPGLLHGPMTDEKSLDQIRDAMQRETSAHVETVNYTKDGRPYWVEIDLVPVSLRGQKASHFVAIEREITERRRHEDEMRRLHAELESRVLLRTAEADQARRDAEQASRAKSEFLATMSHEIRTPMNGVVGMIDVLEHSSLDGPQRQILETARESAYALLSIVDDVLDISKIEAGHMQVERQPFNPVEVIERTCLSFEWLAAQKQVRLNLFVDPCLPRRVLGDALRLRQALVNLIGNAIKFSSGGPRQGQVSVRAESESASGKPGLVVRVVDNGIGIAGDKLDRLFSPFTQADAGTTRRFGGTGLGLAIARALIEKMDGSIEVESAPGRGSSFLVRLPLVTLSGSEDRSLETSRLAEVTCLLVGLPSDRAADLCHYLRHSGAQAASVVDSEAARRFLESLSTGLCVCFLPATDTTAAVEAELQAHARGLPGLQLRFMRLDFGRREQPRTGASIPPVLPAELLLRDALVAAVQVVIRSTEALPPERPYATAGLQPATAPPELRRGPILVAEDHEVNRMVLSRQLKLLGVEADLAADGNEALAMWRRGKHMLLLTDLHMPGMDGFSLADAVRQSEGGGQRMPIIALTANALTSEAERCRQAGMDDFMTKPVRLEQLRDMLARWLPNAPGRRVALQTAEAGGPEANGLPEPAESLPLGPGKDPADLRVLQDLVGSDPAILNELLLVFCSSAQQCSSALRAARAASDWDALADAAHAFKSAARSIGATRLGDCCEQLESIVGAAPLHAADERLEAFFGELEEVLGFVKHKLATSTV